MAAVAGHNLILHFRNHIVRLIAAEGIHRRIYKLNITPTMYFEECTRGWNMPGKGNYEQI